MDLTPPWCRITEHCHKDCNAPTENESQMTMQSLLVVTAGMCPQPHQPALDCTQAHYALLRSWDHTWHCAWRPLISLFLAASLSQLCYRMITWAAVFSYVHCRCRECSLNRRSTSSWILRACTLLIFSLWRTFSQMHCMVLDSNPLCRQIEPFHYFLSITIRSWFVILWHI